MGEAHCSGDMQPGGLLSRPRGKGDDNAVEVTEVKLAGGVKQGN